MLYKKAKKPTRTNYLAASISLILIGQALPLASYAATTTQPSNTQTTDTSGNTGTAVKIKNVKKEYAKLMEAEKNIPSVVSSISSASIKHASNSQSIYSILNSTPSVNVYKQNIGNSVPVMTVRGVRMSQLAIELDGIPMQDLLYGGTGPTGHFTQGANVGLKQLSTIKVYPGVAPPNRQGFATVGGTISYTTRNPSRKRSFELGTKVGSFGTNDYSFDYNTGALGGVDGLRTLFSYNHEYTDGFIKDTPMHYDNFMLSAIKPYDYGLSQLSATLLYGKSSGNSLSSPIPVAKQDENGFYWNWPKSVTYNYTKTHYVTTILGDRTYINPHLVLGAKLFDIYRWEKAYSWINPDYVNASYPYQVNFQASPYFSYGKMGPGTGYYNPAHFTYDPVQEFGSYVAGESAYYTKNQDNTFGIRPSGLLILPHNDVRFGGMAVQAHDWHSSYVWGSLPMPATNGYNSGIYGRNDTRSILSAYVQDKIHLLSNRLRIEPGITYSGVSTIINRPFKNYNDADQNVPHRLSTWFTSTQPYLGISYELTKNTVAYASAAKGTRYSPVVDVNANSTAPSPEYVHMYELGIRRDTPRSYVNFDTWMQNMYDMFSLYINYSTGYSAYENVGKIRMKGAELSGGYKLTPQWEVYGNSSFTLAHYVNGYFANVTPSEGQFGYAFPGQPLADIPRWTGNLGTIFTPDEHTRIKLDTHYTGRMHYTYDLPPTEPNPMLQDATTTSSKKFGNYWIVNLSASHTIPYHAYGIKQIKLSLNIDNLFDKKYYTHYYQIYKEWDSQAVGQPYDAGYPGEPRYISLGVSAKFG
ncbi:MAG: TonB-dependent receptor [Acidihalobacter sp.]|uniref:TonB-dependent receptor n=1 Tax=Acidihalobacter sp. TaxID=1872108 RepID=UPI00307D3297